MATTQTRPHEALSQDGGRADLIDAFVARNRQALNFSIRDARHEREPGGSPGATVEAIIAAGLKRYDATSGRATHSG